MIALNIHSFHGFGLFVLDVHLSCSFILFPSFVIVKSNIAECTDGFILSTSILLSALVLLVSNPNFQNAELSMYLLLSQLPICQFNVTFFLCVIIVCRIIVSITWNIDNNMPSFSFISCLAKNCKCELV